MIFYLLKWGEEFYRRDGNDAPVSLEPEVANLKQLFAEVKCKHQENNRRWREELSERLLGLEAQNIEPPNHIHMGLEGYLGKFSIPFKTSKYQDWVRLMSITA